MEIRLHGRGGQGGVTCAKLLAATYAELGKSVQAFGDYASERSGAPVRAYTRVSDDEISSRNKVYDPDHVVVLDPHLLGEETVSGLAPGGTLLVNSVDPPDAIAKRFPGYRTATVDATAIARRHKIGTRTVVIVNTAIAGAFAEVMGIPFEHLQSVYERLGFLSNLDAAREAAAQVQVIQPDGSVPVVAPAPVSRAPVRPLTEHRSSAPTGIKTGSWRSQQPRYVEKLAPCNAWCPAGNDVVGFVQALATQGSDAGGDVLARSNPLAATCGRVCPAPCMEGCNRAELDGAVNIRGLERFIADQAVIARRNGGRRKRHQSVAIVGGGPAGLAAAYETVRAGHRAVIFEREHKLGGLLYTGIPAYRLPPEVVDKEINAITDLGVHVKHGVSIGSDDLERLSMEHDAVIIASGLQKLRTLDVPGKDLSGVLQGLRFLRGANLGEVPKIAGRVVVLGGGNSAIDCARTALRAGATSVEIAYRRTRAEMPAIPEEIVQAEEEGVALTFQKQPIAFRGSCCRIEQIVFADVDMGEPDETGRRRPVVSERREIVDCDHVLLALGQSADHGLLPEGWELRDERVWAGGEPLRVFAAGDLASGDGTVAHAVGSGRRAATRALRAAGEDIAIIERPPKADAVPATDIRLDHFAPARPAEEAHADPMTRIRDFEAVSLGLPDALEAHRCFSCGHCVSCDTCLVYCPEGSIQRRLQGYEVDHSFCKGCGICVAECPREGMEMVDL